MKKPIAILAFLLYVVLSMHAQKTSIWKGGTPGRNTDWNCAANWKENRVPDEFSCVIIPDVSSSTFSYPSIENRVVEIWSLQCLPPAKVTLVGNARIIQLEPPLQKDGARNEGLAQSDWRPSRQ